MFTLSESFGFQPMSAFSASWPFFAQEFQAPSTHPPFLALPTDWRLVAKGNGSNKRITAGCKVYQVDNHN